jgi:mitochondrial fission protein ELM1
MKSETGERIEKGRAERMAGTIDSAVVTTDSVSFCSEASGVEVFCFEQ